jgi:hypothetical protein
VWYVSTQNTSLVERLQAAYGKKKVVSYEGKITTTFEKDEEGKKVQKKEKKKG